jgi:hypothetical protein
MVGTTMLNCLDLKYAQYCDETNRKNSNISRRKSLAIRLCDEDKDRQNYYCERLIQVIPL